MVRKFKRNNRKNMKNKKNNGCMLQPLFFYSTVTDFAKFLGLSTSNPFSFVM